MVSQLVGGPSLHTTAWLGRLARCRASAGFRRSLNCCRWWLRAWRRCRRRRGRSRWIVHGDCFSASADEAALPVRAGSDLCGRLVRCGQAIRLELGGPAAAAEVLASAAWVCLSPSQPRGGRGGGSGVLKIGSTSLLTTGSFFQSALPGWLGGVGAGMGLGAGLEGEFFSCGIAFSLLRRARWHRSQPRHGLDGTALRHSTTSNGLPTCTVAARRAGTASRRFCCRRLLRWFRCQVQVPPDF